MIATANLKKPDPRKSDAQVAWRAKRMDEVMLKLEGPMTNLYSRWQDERLYEDIADYGKALEKNLPEGWELVKMLSKPFAMILKHPQFPYQVSLSVTARNIGWKPYSTKTGSK
jgi:hypothetical protein